jgi:hypothetical protein
LGAKFRSLAVVPLATPALPANDADPSAARRNSRRVVPIEPEEMLIMAQYSIRRAIQEAGRLIDCVVRRLSP